MNTVFHLQARKGFLHSHLFRDRVDIKEEENVDLKREGFLTQVSEVLQTVVFFGWHSFRPGFFLEVPSFVFLG